MLLFRSLFRVFLFLRLKNTPLPQIPNNKRRGRERDGDAHRRKHLIHRVRDHERAGTAPELTLRDALADVGDLWHEWDDVHATGHGRVEAAQGGEGDPHVEDDDGGAVVADGQLELIFLG